MINKSSTRHNRRSPSKSKLSPVYSILLGIKRILRDAFSSQLLKVLGFILGLALVSAFFEFFIESSTNQSFRTMGDAIWWAFITLTTTGYGDIYPITPAGRFITIFVVMAGVVTLSVLSGVVSSTLVARKLKEEKGLQELKLINHIIICGWNQNAEKILSLFRENGSFSEKYVLINELAEAQISNINYAFKDLDIKFVSGNFTNEEVLLRANIKRASSVIILADFSTPAAAKVDERTLLATLTIKSLNPKVKVCAHITDPASRAALQRANADSIVQSDQHVGYFLVNHILWPGIPEALENLFDYKVGSKFNKVLPPPEFVGKTFGELFNYYRNQQQAILIGLISELKGLSVTDILSSDSDSYLDEFIQRKFAESGKKIGHKHSDVKLNPPDNTLVEPGDFALLIVNNQS